MDKKELKKRLDTTESNLVLMVGPPLSGKSTIIKEIGENCTTISRDAIVESLGEGLSYQDAFKTIDQKEADLRLIDTMREFGKTDENIILDMTHMGKKRRKYHMSHFPNHIKIALIMDVFDKEELFKRNSIREKTENKYIPENVIEDMIKRYTPPSKEEGFDFIVRI